MELTDGIVRYEMAGPPDGQVVVLLHGFFNAYFVWDNTFDALAQADLRVLRYDLYGRGYSDRPNTQYDRDLFDRQLVNLLAALDVTRPVDLVGPSMGERLPSRSRTGTQQQFAACVLSIHRACIPSTG